MSVMVASLERTCLACPSQWEGVTFDGRFVYVRYRHGELTMGMGDTIEEAVEASITSLDLSGDYDGDGYMDTATMLALTGLVYAGDVSGENEVEP